MTSESLLKILKVRVPSENAFEEVVHTIYPEIKNIVFEVDALRDNSVWALWRGDDSVFACSLVAADIAVRLPRAEEEYALLAVNAQPTSEGYRIRIEDLGSLASPFYLSSSLAQDALRGLAQARTYNTCRINHDEGHPVGEIDVSYLPQRHLGLSPVA